MRSSSDLADAFRAQGLEVTPQRRLLFTLLEGTDAPVIDGDTRCTPHSASIVLRGTCASCAAPSAPEPHLSAPPNKEHQHG